MRKHGREVLTIVSLANYIQDLFCSRCLNVMHILFIYLFIMKKHYYFCLKSFMTIIILLVLILAQVSRVAIPWHTTKYLWCITREYCVDKMKKMGAKILLLFYYQTRKPSLLSFNTFYLLFLIFVYFMIYLQTDVNNIDKVVQTYLRVGFE